MSINPFITNIYELRGLARIQQKKYDDAINDYDKALKYDPENQSLWHNRVLCRIQNKDYDHALTELDTMLTRWKKYARGYAMQAEVYMHKKDTALAVHNHFIRLFFWYRFFIHSLMHQRNINISNRHNLCREWNFIFLQSKYNFSSISAEFGLHKTIIGSFPCSGLFEIASKSVNPLSVDPSISTNSYKQVSTMTGISLSTLYRTKLRKEV